MNAEILETRAKGEAATERAAAAIARRVKAPLVLLLDGALGAGKTTFARGFVRALAGGKRVMVQSPTFALARTYATAPPVHHLDLYRLEDGVEAALEELGLRELLDDPAAFCLVEWPRDLALPGAARVTLADDGAGGRVIRAEIPADAIRPAPAAAATRRRRGATKKSAAPSGRGSTAGKSKRKKRARA